MDTRSNRAHDVQKEGRSISSYEGSPNCWASLNSPRFRQHLHWSRLGREKNRHCRLHRLRPVSLDSGSQSCVLEEEEKHEETGYKQCSSTEFQGRSDV